MAIQGRNNISLAISKWKELNYPNVVLAVVVADTYAGTEIVRDDQDNRPSVKPSEADLEDALVLALAEQATKQSQQSARESILTKAELAKTYAGEVAQLFNATLDATQNRTAQSQRYETLKALVDDFPNALTNRFYDDLEAESATSITTTLLGAIDVQLALALPNLSANQQRQMQEYCQYCRVWSTQLATLLLLAR